MAKVNSEKARITGNEVVSLRLPVNKIARGVAFTGWQQALGSVGVSGKTGRNRDRYRERERRTGKKRKREKGEEGDVVWLEQDVHSRNILHAIYEFLEGIDESQLLFVTRLEIKRKFGGDFENAQNAMVTVMSAARSGRECRMVLKQIGKGFGYFAFLILATLVFMYVTFPMERVRVYAEHQLEKVTGFAVSIEELKVSGLVGVELFGTEFSGTKG